MISDDEWRAQRAATLSLARARVEMFIGPPATAHLHCVISPIELAWKGVLFTDPRAAIIDLSPYQYVVRIVSGPLLNEIQDVFQWGGGRTLDESWHADSTVYFDRIDREDKPLPFDERRSRSTRWRYCLSGPLGPRLNQPTGPSVLARQLYWGVRTDAGLWCEGYDGGWPIGKPELHSAECEIGMIAAGYLTPEYFTGLPFTKDDVHNLLHPPKLRPGGDGGLVRQASNAVVCCVPGSVFSKRVANLSRAYSYLPPERGKYRRSRGWGSRLSLVKRLLFGAKIFLRAANTEPDHVIARYRCN